MRNKADKEQVLHKVVRLHIVNRIIFGIFGNLNAYIDILEYIKFLTDDYAKSYVRDDDCDFLS